MKSRLNGNEVHRKVMDESGSVEVLRESIERNYRFKTTFSGYDKKEVQEYIDRLNSDYNENMEELKAQVKCLTEENKELLVRITGRDEELAQVHNEEREKREAALKLQEDVIAGLRDRNQNLLDENQGLYLKIAGLEEHIERIRGCVVDGNAQSAVLNASLKNMLQNKVDECGEILNAWQEQVVVLLAQVNANVGFQRGHSRDSETTE